MKKDKKRIYIFLLIAVIAFFAFSESQAKKEGSEMIGISFYFVAANGTTQAIVGDPGVLYHPNAVGYFTVTVTNTKPIPIMDVEHQTFQDGEAFCNAFPIATYSPAWGSPDLDPFGMGTDTHVRSTTSFDLECYAENHNGPVTFTVNFEYDYRDAQGSLVANVPISDSITVKLFDDTCDNNAGTDVVYGDCATDGDNKGMKCKWIQDSPVYFGEDQTCCLGAGGAWVTDHCEFGCTTDAAEQLGLGDCDLTVNTPGQVQKNNYCDPTTAQMVENCNFCNCFDYHGFTQTACSAGVCTSWRAYTEAVTVDAGGFTPSTS